MIRYWPWLPFLLWIARRAASGPDGELPVITPQAGSRGNTPG